MEIQNSRRQRKNTILNTNLNIEEEFPMVKIKRKYILVLLLIFLCACSANNGSYINREEIFNELVNFEEDCNKSIQLTLLDDPKEIESKELSLVGLIIDSKNQIWFTYNFGLRLFFYSEEKDEWIEVENKFNYSASSGPHILEDDKNFATETTLMILPILQSESNISELRVYVEGAIMQSGQQTDERVCAFIDIPIEEH
ncbi:MAG: hypothetical protein RBT34_14005 [Anaerolineaceae bacterium]|jgi:hypothetical protein|nr:hypothetical protein [Anaerolineaceae bacterium]